MKNRAWFCEHFTNILQTFICFLYSAYNLWSDIPVLEDKVWIVRLGIYLYLLNTLLSNKGSGLGGIQNDERIWSVGFLFQDHSVAGK